MVMLVSFHHGPVYRNLCRVYGVACLDGFWIQKVQLRCDGNTFPRSYPGRCGFAQLATKRDLPPFRRQ